MRNKPSTKRDPRPRAPGRRLGSKKKGASCDELLALLNEYVDGGVNPTICKALKGHLAQCNPCRVVVDNVRQTITLYRDNEPCDLPAAFHQRLHAAIRDCRKANRKPKPVA
jgi:anti-sigma factor RsiW